MPQLYWGILDKSLIFMGVSKTKKLHSETLSAAATSACIGIVEIETFTVQPI
jgi:hypothetical protein